MNNLLQEYLLAYCTLDSDIADDQSNRLYWRCEAEDYEHAVEQLKNAEPECIYHELVKCSGI